MPGARSVLRLAPTWNLRVFIFINGRFHPNLWVKLFSSISWIYDIGTALSLSIELPFWGCSDLKLQREYPISSHLHLSPKSTKGQEENHLSQYCVNSQQIGWLKVSSQILHRVLWQMDCRCDNSHPRHE